MYPQAVELYKIALQKGGVDANVVNIRLGEALAKSQQKDAANQAFATVTGPKQTLAQFWTLWNNQGAQKASGDPQAKPPAAAAS